MRCWRWASTLAPGTPECRTLQEEDFYHSSSSGLWPRALPRRLARPTTACTTMKSSRVSLPPPAGALGSEQRGKAATRNTTPGLICAASATFAIKSARQREPVPSVWCPALAREPRRCSGSRAGMGLPCPGGLLGKMLGVTWSCSCLCQKVAGRAALGWSACC